MTFPDARAAVAALANGSATPADLREIVLSFPQLRSIVAAYPATDAALLGWLSDLHDPVIDAQLARRTGAGTPVTASGPAAAPNEETTQPNPIFRDEQQTVAQAQRIGPPAPRPGPAPLPVSPIYTPVPQAQPATKRRVWLIVVAVVAALVVAGGGVGLAWSLGLFGAPSVAVQPTRSATPRPSSAAATTPAPTTPTPTTPATVPTSPSSPASTPSSAAFTCWDGTPATSLSVCSQPEGIAGLRYVLPSLVDNLGSQTYECPQVNYPKRVTYTVSYDCRLADATRESSPQVVRYRYWVDAKDALKHYRGIFKNGSNEPFTLDGTKVGTIFRSDGPMAEADGRSVMAFVTLDGHMCLSIEGSSDALLSDMLKEARFRVPAQFTGYQGSSPSETTWHS